MLFVFDIHTLLSCARFVAHLFVHHFRSKSRQDCAHHRFQTNNVNSMLQLLFFFRFALLWGCSKKEGEEKPAIRMTVEGSTATTYLWNSTLVFWEYDSIELFAVNCRLGMFHDHNSMINRIFISIFNMFICLYRLMKLDGTSNIITFWLLSERKKKSIARAWAKRWWSVRVIVVVFISVNSRHI